MKTIAEKIKAVKEARDNTWDAYMEAVAKEVNALLKRMGDEAGCTFDIIIKLALDAQEKNKRVDIAKPVVQAYFTVLNFTYIKKLRERYEQAFDNFAELHGIIKENGLNF